MDTVLGVALARGEKAGRCTGDGGSGLCSWRTGCWCVPVRRRKVGDLTPRCSGVLCEFHVHDRDGEDS